MVSRRTDVDIMDKVVVVDDDIVDMALWLMLFGDIIDVRVIIDVDVVVVARGNCRALMMIHRV